MSYCSISGKRLNKANVGLLVNEAGALVTADTDEAELLNIIFALVFSKKASALGQRVQREDELSVAYED